MTLITFFDLAGIAIVALSGTLVAARTGVDLFGALVFAVATGVGGGTLRDILLDVPVFWIATAGSLTVLVLRLGRDPLASSTPECTHRR